MGEVNGKCWWNWLPCRSNLAGRSWARAAAPPELCPGVRDEAFENGRSFQVENECKALTRESHSWRLERDGHGRRGSGVVAREKSGQFGRERWLCFANFLGNNSWYYSRCLGKGVQGGRQERNELGDNCHRNKQKSKDPTLFHRCLYERMFSSLNQIINLGATMYVLSIYLYNTHII